MPQQYDPGSVTRSAQTDAGAGSMGNMPPVLTE
nr:MAG TPA: hypothetical protein [Bacteriophage sp.]